MLVGVDVRALVDRERAELPVSVLCGQDERARAVRQGVVDVSARLEQGADGFELASCTANSGAVNDGPRAAAGAAAPVAAENTPPVDDGPRPGGAAPSWCGP